MKALGWYAALAIGAVFLAIELLPVVFGTGEKATLDWSFTYVTFRFILLPVACVLHVATNLGLLLCWRDRSWTVRLTQFSSIVIPLGILAYSYSEKPRRNSNRRISRKRIAASALPSRIF